MGAAASRASEEERWKSGEVVVFPKWKMTSWVADLAEMESGREEREQEAWTEQEVAAAGVAKEIDGGQ